MGFRSLSWTGVRFLFVAFKADSITLELVRDSLPSEIYQSLDQSMLGSRSLKLKLQAKRRFN